MQYNRLLNDIRDVIKHPLHSNGIYYEHDDTNMQTGYVLIVGPPDTPYFGGYYFFQLNIPNEYPFVPPKVVYLTNDGWTRFNPNLYKNGNVCVSILNTWKGDQWSSCLNIRCVLLSLLTLFNEKPLLNEPGIYETTVDIRVNPTTGILNVVNANPILVPIVPIVPIMESKNESKNESKDEANNTNHINPVNPANFNPLYEIVNNTINGLNENKQRGIPCYKVYNEIIAIKNIEFAVCDLIMGNCQISKKILTLFEDVMKSQFEKNYGTWLAMIEHKQTENTSDLYVHFDMYNMTTIIHPDKYACLKEKLTSVCYYLSNKIS